MEILLSKFKFIKPNLCNVTVNKIHKNIKPTRGLFNITLNNIRY